MFVEPAQARLDIPVLASGRIPDKPASVNAVYNEIALLLFVTSILGLLALRLKLPVIVAYILIGIAA